MKGYFQLLLVSILLSGCSAFPALWYPDSEATTGEVPAGGSHQATYPSEPETGESYEQFAGQPPAVEVIWAIPDSPVEQYTIQYGYSRDSLDNSVTVAAGNLEKYEDPAHGFVYKYVLEGIPEHQTVYVSLIAQAGGESSPPTPIFTIPGK